MTIANKTKDFRTIMAETKNEELVEERERAIRAKNIIIHGVKETHGDEVNSKDEDQGFVTSLIETLKIDIPHPEKVTRLGNKDANKTRPIKIVLRNENEQEKVMNSLRNLKGQERFKGVSITADYTVSERQQIREFAIKAKENNNNEPADSEIVWRVRGTPKNGLCLKKFKKVKENLQN